MSRRTRIFGSLSRRDAILMALGALSMHLLQAFIPFGDRSIVINTHNDFSPGDSTAHDPKRNIPLIDPPPRQVPIEYSRYIPETVIVEHSPGWTLFRNVYMANGTLFIVTSLPSSELPHKRYMIATGLEGYPNPENIAAREPTEQHMDFITPAKAKALWGGDVMKGKRNRILSVKGNTVSIPLLHYKTSC